MLKKFAILMLCFIQIGLAQRFGYSVFVDSVSDKLLTYLTFSIGTPEVSGVKDIDNVYHYDFYIVLSVFTSDKEKKFVADTTSHFKEDIEDGGEIEFYTTWWHYFEAGKYKVSVQVEGNTKYRNYEYEMNIISPLKRVGREFVGFSYIPIVYHDGVTFPVYNNFVGVVQQLLLVIDFYYYSDFPDSAGLFRVLTLNSNVPVARDTVSVKGTKRMLYRIHLDRLKPGTITLYLVCGDYADSIKLDYIYQTEKAVRIIQALKYVATKKTWEKFFKNSTPESAVSDIMKFYEEGVKNDEINFAVKFSEFLARFEYAEKNFVENFMRGYQTDRGYILIVYGFPDYIEIYRAIEYHLTADLMVWYYEMENFTVVFEKFGVGDIWRVKPFAPPPSYSWRVLKFDF